MLHDKIRIMFLGQKPIGEACFDILKRNQNENYRIVSVVSNRDRDNVWWKSNFIYEESNYNSFFFIDNQVPNEEKIKETIKRERINYIVSVGHNWILSSEILQLVSYNEINLHLAKLPEYKGYYSFNHAILNGEKTYSVTLHWMEDKVDEGDYIYINEFPISSTDTAFSLYNKSVEKGVEVFKKFVEGIKIKDSLPRKKMEGEGHFYSKKSLDGMREIKDYHNLEEIQRKSRAFYFPPFEEAYYYIEGEKYYVIPAIK